MRLLFTWFANKSSVVGFYHTHSVVKAQIYMVSLLDFINSIS